MSSISSTTSSLLQAQATQRPSHAHGNKNRVASEISSEASAGTISATDATALISALDSIDASLKSGGTADGGTSGTSGSATSARLDPSTMKDKIDSLIANQVSGGTLTSDQATTLKSLFAKGGKDAKGDGDAVGGAGFPPPGPPPGPPPSSSDTSDPSSTSSDTAVSGTAGAASTSDLLASFIKQLQSTQASGTGYASSGSTTTSSNASALVLDFQS